MICHPVSYPGGGILALIFIFFFTKTPTFFSDSIYFYHLIFQLLCSTIASDLVDCAATAGATTTMGEEASYSLNLPGGLPPLLYVKSPDPLFWSVFLRRCTHRAPYM